MIAEQRLPRLEECRRGGVVARDTRGGVCRVPAQARPCRARLVRGRGAGGGGAGGGGRGAGGGGTVDG